MAAITRSRTAANVNTSPMYSQQLRRFGMTSLLTLFGFILAIVYLLPFLYMTTTALKNDDQIRDLGVLPMSPAIFNPSFTYEGGSYPLYTVTIDRSQRELAHVRQDLPINTFRDPANPDAGEITWQGLLTPELLLQNPVYQVPLEDGTTAELVFQRSNDRGTQHFFLPVGADPETSTLIAYAGSLEDLTRISDTLYEVLTEEFGVMQLELVANGTEINYFVDPADPAAGEIEWVGALDTLEQIEYIIYQVPMPDGGTRDLALAQPGRRESQFLDPANPDQGLIAWEGNWRQLQQAGARFDPTFANFGRVWDGVNFPRLLLNTLAIAMIGMTGTLLSSICVAYAFARFPLPGKNVLFIVLIGTIILPRQVTLVPTFAFFSTIGWTGTWLPLLVPHFFANAYNVFLLRQYFMTLPRELDEAAMIDGAGPFRILISVIIPQSWPAIVAVALFHIVFAWNDYFEPLIYLLGSPELHPISIGIQQYNYVYDIRRNLIQASSLLGLLVPVILFFLSQRFFMQGVRITGVDK